MTSIISIAKSGVILCSISLGLNCCIQSPNKSADQKLLTACENDNFAQIKNAIAKGANPNAQNADGDTALIVLMHARRYTGEGPIKVTETAPGRFKLTGTTKYDPIITAKTRDITPVIFLLDKGARVNARNNYGGTALMVSAFHKTADCMKLLLARGADPKATMTDGGNALDFATGSHRLEILRLLLSKGVDPNSMSGDKVTPLMREVSRGTAESVGLLLKYGAAVYGKDNQGRSALSYAKAAHNRAVVELLIKAGAKE
jgi:ankyrin repeat protein